MRLSGLCNLIYPRLYASLLVLGAITPRDPDASAGLAQALCVETLSFNITFIAGLLIRNMRNCIAPLSSKLTSIATDHIALEAPPNFITLDLTRMAL